MRRLLAALAALCLAPFAPAQGGLQLTGDFNPSSVRLGETAVLQIRIESAAGQPPSLDAPPELPPGLELVRALGGGSSGRAMVNGRTFTWTQWSFAVTPQREGTIVLDPLTVRAGGQTLTGGRLVLNVMPPAMRQFVSGHWLAPMQDAVPGPISVDTGWRRMTSEQVRELREALAQIQSQHTQTFRGNVGLVVTVDDPEPVVGQQVNLSVYLVNGPLAGNQRGIQMEAPQFTAQGGLAPRPGRIHPLQRPSSPSSMNLFTRPFEPLRDADYALVNDPHSDRQRFVHLLHQIAFIPLSAGTVEIPALEATTNYLYERIDALTDGTVQGLNTATLRTPAMTLEVRPLPDGTQTAGRVTVGRGLRLTAALSTHEIPRDGAAMLVVTLEGEADAASLTAPDFSSLSPGLRIEPPVTEPEPEQLIHGDRLVSRVTWECIVRPEEPGTHTIPGIEHTVYDIGREEFLRVRSEPLTLRVSPRASERARVIGGGESEPAGGRSRRQAVANDQPAPLQIDGFLLERPPLPLVTDSAWGWALLLAPLGAFALAIGAARRRAVMESEAGAAIRLRRRAARQLREAERARRLGDATAFHAALAAAVYDHLSDTVGTPTRGATWPEIEQALERRGIAPAVRQRLRACLERTDEARFAPGVDATAAMEADHADTIDALRDLNRALRESKRSRRG